MSDIQSNPGAGQTTRPIQRGTMSNAVLNHESKLWEAMAITLLVGEYVVRLAEMGSYTDEEFTKSIAAGCHGLTLTAAETIHKVLMAENETEPQP